MRTLPFYAPLAVLIFIGTQGLRAADHCDVKALNGTYAMSAAGSILFVPAPFTGLIGPFARVGLVEADGQGHVTVANTASYNGFILAETYGGTYSIGTDCGIEFHLIVPLPIPGTGTPPVLVDVPFTFVGSIAENGRDVSVVIVSPPGASIRVHLRKHDNSSAKCTTKDLIGGYQLDLFGTYVTQPPLGPFVREGSLVFDGSGHFTGSTTSSYSGFVISTESPSGTYSVDGACNVKVDFTSIGSGQAYTWVGTLMDNNNGAALIQTVPAGTVVSGTLKQQ